MRGSRDLRASQACDGARARRERKRKRVGKSRLGRCSVKREAAVARARVMALVPQAIRWDWNGDEVNGKVDPARGE